jgi:hypothetical protein
MSKNDDEQTWLDLHLRARQSPRSGVWWHTFRALKAGNPRQPFGHQQLAAQAGHLVRPIIVPRIHAASTGGAVSRG